MYDLLLSLEEFFTGLTKKVKITRLFYFIHYAMRLFYLVMVKINAKVF